MEIIIVILIVILVFQYAAVMMGLLTDIYVTKRQVKLLLIPFWPVISLFVRKYKSLL